MKLTGLKQKRKAKKLSQSEAAELLKVSVRNYRAYEEGASRPPIEFLERVEDLFECKIKDLK